MTKNLLNKMEDYKNNQNNKVNVDGLFKVENGKIVQNNMPKHAKELIAINEKMMSKANTVNMGKSNFNNKNDTFNM
ncbi:MAG: hypothetical protein MR288_02155 [Firmicutes bacterium]|nr:hypothetical protein [Bacillota bacterium]MDY5041698.1 hypothetical protein [Eubacteriales bacterium]